MGLRLPRRRFCLYQEREDPKGLLGLPDRLEQQDRREQRGHKDLPEW